MGLFNLFGRKHNTAPRNSKDEGYYVDEYEDEEYDDDDYETYRRGNRTISIRRSISPEGYTQIDFGVSNGGQNSYCTRLVLEPRPERINYHKVYTGKVSWYNTLDTMYFDKGNMRDPRNRGPKIRLSVDPDLLQTDNEYTEIVMGDLLSKNRVTSYMNRGLTENPDIPCGNYVGGVRVLRNGRYDKFFDSKTGYYVHNLPEIARYRAGYQEKGRRNQAISRRKRQLYAEMEALDRTDGYNGYNDYNPFDR